MPHDRSLKNVTFVWSTGRSIPPQGHFQLIQAGGHLADYHCQVALKFAEGYAAFADEIEDSAAMSSASRG